MSYLLFMDESGHDHKTMQYEIHGGVAILSTKVFNFTTDMQKSERRIFGCLLSEFKVEIKGSKLLNKEKFKWAEYDYKFTDEEEAKKCVRRFLTAHLENRSPTRKDMCAYGRACLKMVSTILNLMRKHEMFIFAGVIECGIKKPKDENYPDFLRYDMVRLLEVFHMFIEERNESGIMVMDQCEATFDNKFKRQLENYFMFSNSGKSYAYRIMPEPLFIESSTNYLIQVADLCVYIINTGYRKAMSMIRPAREEIRDLFENKIHELQYQRKEMGPKNTLTIRYSIRFHPDPYKENKYKKKEAMQLEPPLATPQPNL